MDKEIFPQITEVSYGQGRASYEKKCIFHERILYRYLMRKIEGWSVKDFLDTEGIKSYALYAVTDFTALFLKDLARNGGADVNDTGTPVVCDKNAAELQFRFHGHPVILPDKLAGRYKEGRTDKIIVMSVLHENEIIDDLLKEGILLNDIISFVSVLYS